MNIFNNRLVQLLLVVCVVVAICIIAGLQFSMHAGSQGVGVGIDRVK